MRVLVPLLIVLAASAVGCGTAPLRDDEALADRYHACGKDGIRDMLGAISEINRNSPDFCTADFSISGSRAEQRYRLLGRLQFDKRQELLYVAFIDFIFRSPLTTLFREGDTIRIYYPADRKMYVDSVKKIDLANYGGIAVDFNLLSGLIAGTVPVIPGYSVRQGLTANDRKGSMLILENPRFYQTISFKENNPDRIKLVAKKTGEKFEVYLSRPVTRGASRLFSSIIIVGHNSRLRLDIHFSGVVLNDPVKVKTYRDSQFPRDLKIIQM